MCFCYEATSILEDMFIKGERYISFSRGLPDSLAHGDTAIVFNRNKLESKGYKFTNIDYTQKFIDKNPHLKEHVSGEDFDKENIIKVLNKRLESLKSPIVNPNIKKIQYFEKMIKDYHYKDIFENVLKACSVEKESVLCDNCMDFEIDDIDAIICNSRTVHQYYPLPREYSSKIIYIHDYITAIITPSSRLNNYAKLLKTYFDKVKEENPTFDIFIHSMYHTAYKIALDTNARKMISNEIKPAMKLSPVFEKAFAYLPTVSKEDRHIVIDLLLNRWILSGVETQLVEEKIKKIIEGKRIN